MKKNKVPHLFYPFPVNTVSLSPPRSSMAFPLSALLLLLLVNLHFSTQQVSAELLLEEGYTVSTVLDGNKPSHQINPKSILPRRGGDLVVLDHHSSVFYTIAVPISQDSEVKRYSGNETSGFADGDLGSAMFNQPQNFAVDWKGNVYVADQANHAIRKISTSGVTTIAGGQSRKAGNVDGPAQYASFSDKFELAFVPEICALLISDSGNRLIRQMNLKPNDCKSGSHWQLGTSGSVLLGVSCLILGSVLTFAVGFIANSSIFSREVIGNHRFSGTWKHYQINLERQVVTICSDIKSAVASSPIYLLMGRIVRMSLSHLSLMFSLGSVEKENLGKEQVSSFNSDVGFNHEITKSEMFTDQLKDLVSYDENLDTSEEMNKTLKLRNDDHEKTDVSNCSYGSIDAMIHANILQFANQPTQWHPLEGPLVGSSGLVKRK